MKRTLVIVGLVAALLVAPRPADAGVKSVLKKVGHVLVHTVEGVALVGALIACAAACR